MIAYEPSSLIDRQIEAVGDALPTGSVRAVQATREVRGLAQDHAGGHVHVGVVVDGLRMLGDADDLLDFIAAVGPDCPADEPVCDTLEDGPGFLAQVVVVAGGVDVLRECPRYAQTHVLFEDQVRRREPNHLFAMARPACPGELEAAVPVQRGVAFGGREPLRPVFEEGIGRLRRGQQQCRKGEGLDIPHHVASVIVVVGPVGEAEHRGAEQG